MPLSDNHLDDPDNGSVQPLHAENTGERYASARSSATARLHAAKRRERSPRALVRPHAGRPGELRAPTRLRSARLVLAFSVLAAVLIASFLESPAPGNQVQEVVLASKKTQSKPARSADNPLHFVIQDDAVFLHRPEQLQESLAEVKRMGFTHIRVTAGWHTLTRDATSKARPAFDASDPAAYEQERWSNLDRLVRAADELGLQMMIDVAFWAPYWATEDAADSEGQRARTNISAEHYRDFAVATVRRYRGDFKGNAAEEAALPLVSVFTIWNEPNIPGFWKPQFLPRADGGRIAASPILYRHMVRTSYPAMKTANPDAKVLVGGLAPGGSYDTDGLRGGVPPLQFIRALACVDKRLQPVTYEGCEQHEAVPGDGYAHHTYNFDGRPDERSKRDDITIGDLERLAKTLGTLADRDRIANGWRDIYLTEHGYFTKPTGGHREVPNEYEAARYMRWSHALAWRVPEVKMTSQFLLRDSDCEVEQNGSCLPWPTGIQQSDGSDKSLAAHMRFGVIALRQADTSRVWVWVRGGPERYGQRLRLQARSAGGSYRTVRQRVDITSSHGGIYSAWLDDSQRSRLQYVRVQRQGDDGRWRTIRREPVQQPTSK